MAKRADTSSSNANNGATARRSERIKNKPAAEKATSLPMRRRAHPKKKKPDAAIAKLLKLRKAKPWQQREGRIAQAMHGAGMAAKKMKDVLGGIAKADPLVMELAKLASKNPAALGYDYQRAFSAKKKRLSPYFQQEYSIEYIRELRAGEKVLRVCVPYEPNHLEYIPNDVYVRTKWNAFRAQIVRMVEDQFEATDEIYAFDMYKDMLSKEILAETKKSHIILALRLNGVEISEYYARGEYERIEVFFEEPEAKAGYHLDLVRFVPGMLWG